MKKFKKRPIKLFENEILKCPFCDFDYLHQRITTVFERAEDETEIIVHTVHPGTIVIGNATSDNPDLGSQNPSSRRNGLNIQFMCEGCDEWPVLSIWQHKGTTHIIWEKHEWKTQG